MKTKVIFAALPLLLILGCLAIRPYISYEPYSAEGIYLSDITDSFDSRPEPVAFLDLLNIKGHIWGSFKAGIGTLTNFGTPFRKEFSLPSEFLGSNLKRRTKKVDGFTRDITSCIDTINSTPSGLPQSNLWVPLVTALNRLSRSKAQTRFLVANSDLCENRKAAFSIYRAKDKQLLVKDRAAVENLFENMAKPGDLHGVDVYFVFAAKNEKGDENYNLMYGLFNDMLTKAGANVYTGSNLVSQNN